MSASIPPKYPAPPVESVWCPNCEDIKPVRYDRMESDLSDHPATDILCDECHFIVATLHHPADPHASDLTAISRIESVD